MADLQLALTQSRFALLTAFRTPRTVVFTMAFPVVLLVMFDSIFTNGAADSVTFAGGTITASAYQAGQLDLVLDDQHAYGGGKHVSPARAARADQWEEEAGHFASDRGAAR